MSRTELKERHLKPATSGGEFIRNQIGKLVHRADFTVEGLENVENIEGGAIIVVAPHNGHVDTALVRMAFDKESRKLMFAIAAGDYWERIGWKQLANSIARIIPISREGREQSYHDLEKVAELVLGGERVIIFPEGTRQRNPQTPISKRVFRTGLGLLVLMTEGKVPIIPVHLEGNERLMPTGAKLPQFREKGVPHPVTVKIGKPINLSSYATEPIEKMSPAEISQQRKIIAKFVHGYFEILEETPSPKPEERKIEPY